MTIPLLCSRCGDVTLPAGEVVLRAHRYVEVTWNCPGCDRAVSRVCTTGEASALARAGAAVLVVAADHPVDQVVAEGDPSRLHDLGGLVRGEDWLEQLL